MHVSYCTFILCVSLAIATISLKRTGWLNRVVEYHKNQFLNDVEKMIPIQINATIERMPAGYVDSPAWNYESVVQLLILIRESKTARPVRVALRRMLKPSRRFMSRNDSYKYFPSITKYELYYDSEERINEEYLYVNDEALITVSNPVEARLPSGQISIKLLKEIMEARAIAAKQMPQTTRLHIDWKPMNKTTSTTGASSDATTGGPEGDNTGATGGDEATKSGTEGGEGPSEPGETETSAPTTDAAERRHWNKV